MIIRRLVEVSVLPPPTIQIELTEEEAVFLLAALERDKSELSTALSDQLVFIGVNAP